MKKPRRTSVVILITLAELAWLAAFGLLFAYRGKVGELGRMRQSLTTISNELARWEAKSPETAELFRRADAAEAEKKRMANRLGVFEKFLAGVPPEEAARRLAGAEEAERKRAAAEERAAKLQRELEQREQSESTAVAAMREAEAKVAKLEERMRTLPPNVDDLAKELKDATNQVAELKRQLKAAQGEKERVLADVRHREIGEFSVRRELTGLPEGNLRRVIFLVDTSSSMRGSPAWQTAKNLVRTWLEFLPVEECALVNFNDRAVGFPDRVYHRVREPGGAEVRGQREALLAVFDRAAGGTYTDLLRGLQLAYQYPQPDVMVLFTDGHPRVASRSDAAVARDVFSEVAKHRGIPILTVGVGTYETEGAEGPKPKTNAPVAFLKELARRTGGNFLGR